MSDVQPQEQTDATDGTKAIDGLKKEVIEALKTCYDP